MIRLSGAITTLAAKHETSLSASLIKSSIKLPSGSLVAAANSWHTTFIPSTDCKLTVYTLSATLDEHNN